MNQELLTILKGASDYDQEITATTQLEDDLGFTSMKMIMFLNKACKSLSIKMTDLDAEKIGEFKTVEELLNYLATFKQ
ncbi:acyl carrier protein [Kordia jejudonensis]|uniref:acyl carrier protein n=1 Tax=Kordia jejudonensis TaxID=1348245 RepID=UPI0006294F7B|nr:phosphopantetheine-binding protein [Kordia jejudonensis]